MLTDAAIRKLSCREKPYKVADMYGLYLLMHPNGSRYWRFDYRLQVAAGPRSLNCYALTPNGGARLALPLDRDL